MNTPPELPQQQMTAQLWFEGGGQEAELQKVGAIKDAEKRKAALQQFNERNTAFMEEKAAREQAPEKAKTHPAIEEAIADTMKRERHWVRDIAGMSDEQLRDRYLDRAMKQDIARNRLDPQIVTLSEYKAARPDLVEFAEKFTRSELEKKEILSRMIQDRRFNVARAKVEYERKLNPEIVTVAERNLSSRNVPGVKYNDVLFAEVSQVKKTLTNAKATGFKL